MAFQELYILNTTKNMKTEIYNNDIFWIAHPNIYVSVYMRRDWFNMNMTSFVVKYVNEIKRSKSDCKKNAIAEVLKNVWLEMTTNNKYAVMSALSSGEHFADTFHTILMMQDFFDCDFLRMCIYKTYKVCAKKDFYKKTKI